MSVIIYTYFLSFLFQKKQFQSTKNQPINTEKQIL